MGNYVPRAVEVPQDLTMREVEKAVQICMRLGLLENRAGYLIIPHGVGAEVPYELWDPQDD